MGVPENTAGKAEAINALRESQRSRHRTQSVIDMATRYIREIAAARERNHFAESIRKTMGEAR